MVHSPKTIVLSHSLFHLICISLSTKQRQTGEVRIGSSVWGLDQVYTSLSAIKTQISLLMFCFRAGWTVRVAKKVFCFRWSFFMFHGQNTKLEFLQMVDNFSKANCGVLNSPKKEMKSLFWSSNLFRIVNFIRFFGKLRRL